MLLDYPFIALFVVIDVRNDEVNHLYVAAKVLDQLGVSKHLFVVYVAENLHPGASLDVYAPPIDAYFDEHLYRFRC